MDPQNHPQTTIAAPATPPGRGGIGIIRVSGPQVKTIARGMLGDLPKPRYAAYRHFRDAQAHIIDSGIALFFPGPHSFTGEDVLELQGHGGAVMLDWVMERVLALGARPAEPGEFSRRAFLNGRLDLAQAEAMADLIDSTSRQAARGAQRSLQGDFSEAVNGLLENLVALRSRVEAAIDFADEAEDFFPAREWLPAVAALVGDLEEIATRARQGSRLREGLRVAILGRPNVGKSSLLNRLAGRESAIVTEIPGTTRDILREEILLEGLPIRLQDTAGLRETEDPIEKIGVDRALGAARQADLLLLVVEDPTGITPADEAILGAIAPRPPTLVVRNKVDLSGGTESLGEGAEIRLSARTGAGLDHLKARIKAQAGFQGEGEGGESEGIYLARRRHLNALERTGQAIHRAGAQLGPQGALELAAEELRLAQQALGEITGQFTTEELLDHIFGRFCIGK